jgi:hypothetical protein
MSETIYLGSGIATGKSVVAITIVGQTSPECREELLAFLKYWAKHCGVKLTLTTSVKKKKKKAKKKK